MKWAGKCFSSLRKSSIPVHTIVVDNGSTDGTQDYVKTHFPEVDFIQSEQNLGFGKANNIGIERAYQQGADFFYLMNQDAWIFENSFEEMLKVYQSYPNKEEIGIISPMHLDGSEQKLDIFIDKYISQNFENRMISDIYCNLMKDNYEISFINAAHWLIPRKTIEEIGGFNPYFFHYGEDNEYVNRIHYHQKKIILATQSKVVHDGKQSLNKVNYQLFLDSSIEINIMNPSDPSAYSREIKSLQQSIVKNILTRNLGLAKTLHKKLKKLKLEKAILLENKNMVGKKGHSFLNI